MNLHDACFQNLLEKKILEDILNHHFQLVYGEAELQEIDYVLKSTLRKYDKEDVFFKKLLENNDDESKLLIQELRKSLCEGNEKTICHEKNHSPKTMLTLSKLLIKVGDYQLASEVIWCSALLAIREFIANRQLNVKLHSHNGAYTFAKALSDDIGKQFIVFDNCHLIFFSYRTEITRVNNALEEANELFQKLREFKLSDEKKKKLENDRFD